MVFRHATPWSWSFYWGAHSFNSLKGLSLIHGSQHGSSWAIAPGSSVLSPGSSVLSSASPCRHRAGIREKNSNLRNFPSRSTRMENDPYHSWKAPCSFRVATGSPILRPASSGCQTPGCTRWLHGRNTVPSRSDTNHFSSVYSRTENLILPRICAKDHSGCLPGVYTVMPETTRMIPEQWSVNVWKPLLSLKDVPQLCLCATWLCKPAGYNNNITIPHVKAVPER